MKIILINPPLANHLNSVLPSIIEDQRGYNPPLGLLYIAAYLQKYCPSADLEIIDCPAEAIKHCEIGGIIRQKKPDIVGITVMTFTLLDCLLLSAEIKKVDKNIKTVFGGPHVNIYGRETLELGNVDYIVLGEGEMTFCKLIENLNNQAELKKIPGLQFFDQNGNFIDTGLAPIIQDLDSLPRPARNLIDANKYSSILGSGGLVTTMMTSRGCPYQCLFCDRPHLGKKFRAFSAAYVVSEIEDCLRYGISEFLMYDDTFTIDRQRVFDICDKIIKKNLKIRWDIRARVNTVDKEMLEKLKKAGCVRIHYGVESGVQRILDVLRKGVTLEQIEKVFRLTRQVGIETLAYFMIGNPDETKEDIEKTILFMKKIKPDYVHISATTPFPATELYYLAIKRGVIEKDVWLEFAKCPDRNFTPRLWDEIVSIMDLQKYIRQAYKGFYFRPSYICKRILSLKSPAELKIKIKAAWRMLKI